jgi:hypothetical protein
LSKLEIRSDAGIQHQNGKKPRDLSAYDAGFGIPTLTAYRRYRWASATALAVMRKPRQADSKVA